MKLESIEQNGHNENVPWIMAGPCSAETEEQVMQTAHALAKQGVTCFRAGVWKPRTKPGGFEGIGVTALKWLKRVKKETGMFVATEVATREHVFEAIKAGIDILWVGARTTVNPFAVQDIADALRGTDIPVLVKNPVNPDLELWVGALERLYNVGVCRLAAIHRGFSSREQSLYRNDPLWQIPMDLKKRIPELPILCDPSHIAGKSELVADISRQALQCSCFDGLFVESHCQPEVALSDARQQITPDKIVDLLQLWLSGPEALEGDKLSGLRGQIDRIDEEFLKLLARRIHIALEIGEFKKRNDMPILQSNRYNEIIDNRIRLGEMMQLNPSFVKKILDDIHEESVKQQTMNPNQEEIFS